ncbi:MAG: bifunctional riboflavin kinase/FAD synthetase [Gammaproteobacteria bacterium]|nr:bifunctional riboflavin kinase/FAD synthetase [Gammaproteobacteria bacterium]
MIVVHGFDSINNRFINLDKSVKSVVTIGNFDGVHLGHRFIFDRVFKLSKITAGENLKRVCVTFEPHSKDFFSKQAARLTTCKDKLKLLEQLGFDIVWIINFNNRTKNITPEDFITKIYSQFYFKYLIVGSDFRFGKDRLGNVNFLETMATPQKLNFNLEIIEDYIVTDQRISSSEIKKLLLAGNIDVREYLGRFYGFSSKVIRGQQKGRQIGYPTANLHIKPGQLILPTGVYAVLIYYKNTCYYAMANWGIRPTMGNSLELVLEAHIFNFEANIYEQEVVILFIEKIRSEKRFQSIEHLRLQLGQDADQAQKIFANLVIDV